MGINLITGGLGFLGRNLAKNLFALGEEVIIFDVLKDYKFLRTLPKGIKYITGDIRDPSQIQAAVKNYQIDTIYHLAAILPPHSEDNLFNTFAVNIQGTLNVLETALADPMKKVVFLSSIATYGISLPPLVNEDVPQHPRNMYGVTKVCSEKIGEQYWRKYGLNFRAVRFPPILGAGRKDSAQSAFSYLAIREAALGRPYTINVAADTRLPLLYIQDAVGCLISLQGADEKVLSRRIYNIHGFSASAGEIVDTIRRFIPQAKFSYGPDQAVMDIIRSWPILDDTRAREEWGWHPKYNLEEAVKDFIAEVRAHPEIYH